MKILVCPDKFKGSLTAREVCTAIRETVLDMHPDVEVLSIPLADGGEGTCALLTDWYEGHRVALRVHGPLFQKVTAGYGLSRNEDSAFIEMAEASGLMLLKPEERNPLFTTSIGTGELIADALDRGVHRIILGIGGSATNDAGIGMAAALGYKFYDSSGELLPPIGENLIHIHVINLKEIHPRLREVHFTTLCDVTNPLYGPDGAAHVYGPQKGADASAIDVLEAGLRNFRRIVHKQLKVSVDFPGAGAAGGLGAGTRAFLGANIKRGVSFMIENRGLASKVNEADLIITGEGKIDNQTFSGKVVSEIIRLSALADKPVYVVCGVCEVPKEQARACGITSVISLVDENISSEAAIRHADAYIRKRIRQAFFNLPRP